MKKYFIAFILLVGSYSQADQSGITAATEGSLFFSMLVTFSPTVLSDCAIFQDCNAFKSVVDSKEDAALFVATDGKIKAVKLTLALEILRANQAEGTENLSDLELAQAILAL